MQQNNIPIVVLRKVKFLMATPPSIFHTQRHNPEQNESAYIFQTYRSKIAYFRYCRVKSLLTKDCCFEVKKKLN